jgi:Cupredoxin-like domain
MNARKMIPAMLAVTLALGGCALSGIETGYRSITIKNHQLQPAQIKVPAYKPFMLTVDGFDDKDLAISAPDLGINLLRIPATQEDNSPIRADRILPGHNARLPLGPLKPGRYVISCACHGEPSEAVLIAQ